MEQLEQKIDAINEKMNELEGEKGMLSNTKIEPPKPKFTVYIPIKGELIDEKLAEYINEQGSAVPWLRLSEGNYSYGSKKVNVKYMRLHLIIKVGGGSMTIEEFT